MDYAKLPALGSLHYPYAPRTGGVAVREEKVTEIEAARRPRATVEYVVQGEVLEREPRRYETAGDYLRGRMFEQSPYGGQAGTESAANAGTGRRAVGTYLGHTRENILPDTGRGVEVDYFI